VLSARRLPPLRTINPFPVALAVRLCADVRSRLRNLDQNVVLLVIVHGGDVAALRFAIVH